MLGSILRSRGLGFIDFRWTLWTPSLGQRRSGDNGWGVSRLRPLVRSLLASAALVAAISLGGCNTDGVTLATSGKALAPLSSRMVSDIEQKNMDKDSPILVRVFKQESEFEVWKQDRTGRFALLKTYPICRWSGELGPKVKEGDRQAPEGFYTITPGQMNPNSQFYLAFDLGYPNAFDRAHGRTGAHLMVHGDCSSRGCYSMTDEQIQEIYALGREAFFGGQRAFQVQAYPFRMTPENFAKHRNSPHMAFWKMLKRGNDHFETTKLEPKVNVCEKRYVFDAEDPNDPLRPLPFRAADKCPVFTVADDVVASVKEKQRTDDIRIAQLSNRTPVAPIRTGADGGMHPVFVAAVKRNEVGVSPSTSAYSTASIPGTIPATVRPPRIPELSDAPLVTGNPIAPPAGGSHSISNESPMMAAVGATSAPVRVASAEPMVPASTPKESKSNFFSGLFASKPKPADEKPSVMDRMARTMGLSRAEDKAPPPPAAAAPKPRVAAAPAAPKPAPMPATAKPASAPAPGAIRPKPADEPRTAAPAPAAPAQQAPAGGTMAGAAPVVPAGNFDNRWSAFR
jgi:murein L,D-transpeptidase YafK